MHSQMHQTPFISVTNLLPPSYLVMFVGPLLMSSECQVLLIHSELPPGYHWQADV